MKSKQVYLESLIADFPLGGIDTGDNIEGMTVYEVFERLLTGTSLSSTLTVNNNSGITDLTFVGATVTNPSTGHVTITVNGLNEEDPVFTSSPAFTITNTDIQHWEDAYSWENHALYNYVVSTNSYANPSWIASLAYSKITGVPSFILSSQIGIAGGIVPLNSSGYIDSTYLPSYVDDVIEVSNFASLPTTGEQGKIYVTVNNGNGYRWSGSMYIQILTSGGGGGATAFTELTDVPSSYTGESLKIVRVKSDESGLEFATISGGSSQTLADTLALGNESIGNDIILTSTDKIWFGDPIDSNIYMSSPSNSLWQLVGTSTIDANYYSFLSVTYDDITLSRQKTTGEYSSISLSDPFTASDPQVILTSAQGGDSFAIAVKKNGLWLGTDYTTLTGPTAGYVLAQKSDNSGLEYVDPSTFGGGGGGSMIYPGAGIAVSTGSAWDTSITDNSANWNTAYGWGDHSIAGYLTSSTAASTYFPIPAGTTAQYIRGNGTLATFPTNVSSFTNDSGYITSSSLSSYLPLAGGTMTGAIILSSTRLDSATSLELGTTNSTSVNIATTTGQTTVNNRLDAKVSVRVGVLSSVKGTITLYNASGATFVFDPLVGPGGGTFTYTLPSQSGTLAIQGQSPQFSTVYFGTGSTTTGQAVFYNSTNNNTITLQAGVTSASVTYTLPTTDGTSGYVLSTNGSGVLSWISASGGGFSLSGKYLKNVTQATVTGTTSSTILTSISIPANTYAANDVINLISRTSRSTTTGLMLIRFYVNTSVSLSGATLLGAISNSGSITSITKRTLFVTGANTILSNSASNVITDDVWSASATSSVAIDWTVQQYLLITCQPAASGETYTHNFTTLTPLG